MRNPLGAPWINEKLLTELEDAYAREHLQSYWSEEEPAVLAALDHIAHDLPANRYQPIGVLGVGGSGVVLRLRDSQFPTIDNALKFPRPVPGKVEEVAGLLTQEISYLAKLRHRNIVRILHYSSISSAGVYGRLPYYLMEAIDGTDSRKHLRANFSSYTVLNLLLDAAEVVRYLHFFDGGFAHLDLKPSNFVVDNDGNAVMIDLGTCKRLAVDAPDITTIACTRPYAHPELVRRLADDPTDENRAKGDVERSSIRPEWDLWSLGLTILSWLGLEHGSGEPQEMQLFYSLDAYSRKYFLLIVARLLAGPYLPHWIEGQTGLSHQFLESERILTATSLYELLQRLAGTSNPLDRVPELAAAQTNTIQAAPGVHVPVTEALQHVLDHRLFRRLNSISQLGLVSQVYPGAKHSRREHSLGTYANVQRLIRTLYSDQASPLFRQLISERNLRCTLLAALLHDLGQFPLAHDLEEIDSRTFDHSELTAAMVEGAWDKKKRGSRKITFTDLDGVFKSWKVERSQVLAILNARPGNLSARPKDKLLRSLFDGPIDADKLDYLLRDGRHLDLPYPQGIDVERLFGTVTTVIVSAGGSRDVPVLGVQSKGKVAAEFLTMARYAMFSQAYWHHAVRAQKAMLFRAVEALLAQQSNEVRWRELQADFLEMVVALPEILFESSTADRNLFAERVESHRIDIAGRGTDLAATDAAVLAWIGEYLAREKLPETVLIDGILRRRLFKRLWVVSREMDQALWDDIVDRWNKLDKNQKHRVAYRYEEIVAGRLRTKGLTDVTSLRGATALDEIDRSVRGRIPWLLIDVPGQRPGSEVALHYVVEAQRRALRRDNRSIGETQPSDIWIRYAKDLVLVAGKVRVYCNPGLVDSVEASLEWRQGTDDLSAAIEQVAG